MKSEPKSERIVLYARVSTEEQASDDHFSIDAQLNEMREYALSRNWDVIASFVDDGISGTRFDRPQLTIALEMVKAEECDILLVHELSRLSRSIFHTLDIFDILGKHHVGFASVKDPDFNFTKPSDRLFLTILAAMNQYYIDNLRMHTSKAKRERARQGLYNASITPYGYQHDGGAKDPPTIAPVEAKAVRMIFDQYATGRFTYNEVADAISDAGYKPRKRARFSKDSIAQMMRNRFYMGKIEYRTHPSNQTEIFEGVHEAIISEELWERCKQVRDVRSSSSRAVQKPFRVYLLSQLAHCDVCQRTLRSQASATGAYYRETSYQRGYIDCPHQKQGTRTEPVDAYLDEIIKAMALPDAWVEEIRGRINEDGEVDSLRRKRVRLEAERQRAKRLYIEGEFGEDLGMYKTQMAQIRRELDSIPSYDQLEGLKSTIKAVQALHKTWEDAVPADRRDLLRLMLRKVWVDVPGKRVVALQPQAFLLPILRNVAMLEEREFGYFVPRWEPEANMPTISRVAPLTSVPEQGVALPFLAASPLQPTSRTRMAQGVSKALIKIRENGIEPEKIVQVTHPDRVALPIGLRKWPKAAHDEIGAQALSQVAKDDIHLLVSQLLLWDKMVAREDTSTLIETIYKQMKPGGVWYLVEILAQDMPAHWTYRYFPPLWNLVKAQTWNTYTLYNQIHNLGFEVELRRKIYYQPIRLKVAQAIAENRPGILAQLPDTAFQAGINHLKEEIEQMGEDYVLGSECNLVEIWAQKPMG